MISSDINDIQQIDNMNPEIAIQILIILIRDINIDDEEED